MESSPNLNLLPRIDEALGSQRWLIPVPAELRGRYDSEQLRDRRPHNRRVVLIMTLIFTLFLFSQFRTAPEIAPLSAVLRCGVMCPFVLAFVLADGHDPLGKKHGAMMVVIALMAGLISAILTVLTHGTTHTNMDDVHATPLILLATGLIARLTPWEVVCTAGISVAVFVASIIVAPSVPGVELGSLVLMDVAIGAAAVVFNLQLEARDRKLFLLRTSERINRAELAARNRGLLKQTQTDALTGVANRRSFDEALARAWTVAGAVGLIMIDIDHFKAFNDHYGHHGGDDCLRMVALRARKEARIGDVFARYGGEEFAVILPGANVAAAAAVAERIRAAVEGMGLPHEGAGGVVTVSLGVASMEVGAGGNAEKLFQQADTNLYEAKRGGRNQVNIGAANAPVA